METSTWYQVNNESELDTPGLLIYPDRVAHNIRSMLEMTGSPQRLMPHLKTNKCSAVINLLLNAGIRQFKVSTIAEAELAAICGAQTILLAHQLVGPKIDRLFRLIERYPETEFHALVDQHDAVQNLNKGAEHHGEDLGVWIDVNSGMNRSGISPSYELLDLAHFLADQTSLRLIGLHVYDGHLRQSDFEQRKRQVVDEFEHVLDQFNELKAKHPKLLLVAGGTPSFCVHAQFPDRICSPGTCVFWDWGYSEKLPEQAFQFGVVLVSRVISQPAPGLVTLDMGHKAVAPENPIDKRILWLNRKGELIAQSEEHGIVSVSPDSEVHLGDLWYGIPYHICPTINLYRELQVVRNGSISDTWEVLGSQRKLNV
ncbi:D-TA family PLP-dependent enzyme [Aureitalea marina]|uniref:D-serine dehydratase-like domain-containing protein n=1 Tax=Aureitalea marina TaxID=930804 RepID=A0A2S7KP50_9FLAO|nr:D-TA family PLP-dependent enzyme [Aureitalea marina]PQB04409.1 hypothetical protein BST85_05480 [Aureitalea marina]